MLNEGKVEESLEYVTKLMVGDQYRAFLSREILANLFIDNLKI